jgi:hypothetical protein
LHQHLQEIPAKRLISAIDVRGTNRARIRRLVPVRKARLLSPAAIPALLVALCVGGCVDAPITQDQLEANGELKGGPAPLANLGQVAFATHARPMAQTAARMSAVLAAQPSGPLQDASAFTTDVGMVHLHLRADGLAEARPVTARWTHAGVAVAFPAELSPSGALSLTSSMPILPDQAGKWRVEVLAAANADGDAPLLFEREFEVILPAEPTPAAGATE